MNSVPSEDAGRRRGRIFRRPWVVLLGVAVLCAAWSAVWATMRSRLITEVDHQLARLERDGVRIVCPDRAVGGFPFRLEISCRDPGLEIAGRGVGGSVAALRIVAQIWDPRLVLAEADGPLVAEEAGRTRVDATWRGLRASLRWSTAGIERLSLSAEGLDLTRRETGAGVARLQAEHLEAHGRGSGAHDVDVAVSVASGVATVEGKRIGPPRSDLSLAATLREVFPFGPGDPARAFAARGGRIEPIRADFAVGGVRVAGKGALTLGSDGLLDGMIGFAATGLEAVVTQAAALGPETAGVLGGFVLLGKASNDPDLPGRRLDLVVDHGRPRFGRILMPPMAPLFRP